MDYCASSSYEPSKFFEGIYGEDCASVLQIVSYNSTPLLLFALPTLFCVCSGDLDTHNLYLGISNNKYKCETIKSFFSLLVLD